MAAWDRWQVVCLAALSVEDVEDVYIFRILFIGFVLIGIGIALVRWERKDIKETRLAAKSPIGLPVMIEAVGRAVGSQTVAVRSNSDNILERLTAMQRNMDHSGDRNGHKV